MLTDRTDILLVLNSNLQFTVTTNAEPCSNMETHSIFLDRRMIQLIPSSTANRFTLSQNSNDAPILFITSVFSIHETATALKTLLFATTTVTVSAARALKKGLIKKTDLKIYRNREYPRFWLTQGGIFVALVEGGDATNLLQNTLKSYPNDKTLQCCLELSPLLGLEGFKIALSAIKDKGKLDDSDMMKIFLAHAQKEVSVKQFRKLIEILKRYPKEYYRTKKNLSQINKVLTKLESLI